MQKIDKLIKFSLDRAAPKRTRRPRGEDQTAIKRQIKDQIRKKQLSVSFVARQSGVRWLQKILCDPRRRISAAQMGKILDTLSKF